VLTIILVGCTSRTQETQIRNMTSLAELAAKTSEIAQQLQSKEITAEEFNTLTLALQKKYEELTLNGEKISQEDTEIMEEQIDPAEACALPERAEKL